MRKITLNKKELEALGNHIQIHYDNAVMELAAKRSKWSKFIKQYKALRVREKKTFPWVGASNMFIPELPNSVTTVAAYIMAAVFGGRPVMKADNYFEEDAEMCRELEVLIDFYIRTVQRQQPYWRRHLPYLLLLGTHVSKQVYKKDSVMGWPFMKPIGVPLVQFLHYPGLIDLQRSVFTGDVQYVSWHSLLDMVERVDGPLKKNLSEVLNSMNLAVSQVNAKTWEHEQGSAFVPPGYTALLDAYTLFSTSTTKMPVKLRVQYALDLMKVVDVEEYEDWELPYVPFYWRRDEDSFFGIGMGDLAWTLQHGLNSAGNMFVDNSLLANTKVFAIAKGSGLNPQEPIYPGRQLPVDPNSISVLQMGDVYPSSLALIEMLRRMIQEATVAPEAFKGMPDSIAKSGVSPGVVGSGIGQSTMRLSFFTGEFEEGLVEMMWHSLVVLSKFAGNELKVRLPDIEGPEKIFEWLEEDGDTKEEEIVADGTVAGMVAARVEPAMRPEIEERIFKMQADLISRSKFELRVSRKDVAGVQEQQAAMLLVQILNSYIQKVMEFAGIMGKMQQSGQADPNLVSAATQAWRAINVVMRRVFSAFAIEDTQQLIIKLEGVIDGIERGVGSLGRLVEGANGGLPSGGNDMSAEATQGAAGAPSGILGGRPVGEASDSGGVGGPGSFGIDELVGQ